MRTTSGAGPASWPTSSSAARAEPTASRRPPVAVGFSNGANIAAALLLLRPGTLAGALLLRPMVPLVPDPLPALGGVPVQINAGVADPIVTPEQSEALGALLRQAGANVSLDWVQGRTYPELDRPRDRGAIPRADLRRRLTRRRVRSLFSFAVARRVALVDRCRDCGSPGVGAAHLSPPAGAAVRPARRTEDLCDALYCP